MKLIFLFLINVSLIPNIFSQQSAYKATELDNKNIIKIGVQHISQYKDENNLSFDQIIKQKFDVLPKGRVNFGYGMFF